MPLAHAYGEATYYLECSAAIARLRSDARWLLSGHESREELRTLERHTIPTLRPRLTWPPRRVTRALHAPRVAWQYPGLRLIHYWTTKAGAPPGAPYVLTILDGMALSGQFGEQGDVAEARRLALGARAVMTLTRESGDLIQEALGIPGLQVVAVGAGVDIDRFTPDESADDRETLARHGLSVSYMLYVGGWAERKGLSTLAEALTTFEGATRPLIALTGNPTPEQLPMAQRLRQSGCRLLGYVSEREMPTLIRHASAVVLPSFAEGFGLPIIEAQAAGTPVVASDLPVARSVSGGHCLFVQPGDSAALALALIEVGRRGAELVDAGIANARHHSWGQVAWRIAAVYASARNSA